MEHTGAVAVLIMLAFLVASAASSDPACCNDYHSWGSQNQLTNGCSSDQNASCNSWCQASCRGGECKLRGGQHKCHCYC